MENNEIENLIKGTIEELIAKMGIFSEVEIKKNSEEDGSELIFNIKTNESNFLIGQYGVNLQSLQHLARLLVRKKTEEKINFLVDVNSYRQEKNKSVENLAKEAAAQAIREKRAVILRPMSSYERRIVHLELAENSQIKTESVGEGENRKIVIKPAELV